MSDKGLEENLSTYLDQGQEKAAEAADSTENSGVRGGISTREPIDGSGAQASGEPALVNQNQQTGEDIAAAPDPSNLEADPWRASPVLIAEITDLGFSRICAEKALFYTGNSSADAAVCWILDNPQSQTDTTPLCLEGGRSSSNSSSGGETGDMYKMVFAVNCSLKMGLGKVAAQVGHATLSLYRTMEQRRSLDDALADWRRSGEMKVVLRADDEPQLADLQRRATEAGLASYLVHDAGRTQIAAGSATVLSVFGPSRAVDLLTGRLKLL